MVVKFSHAFLKSLSYSGKQQYYLDKHPLGLPGKLGIRVGKATMSWFVQYHTGGKRHKCNIAKYPTVGLGDARKKAVDMLLEISNGADPLKKKQQYKTSPTVGDLWDAYLEWCNLKRKKKSPDTVYAEWRYWERDIEPQLKDVKVQDVTPQLLSDILDKKAKHAPVAANRLHTLFMQMFKPALRKGWITVHPLQWIEKPGGSEPPRQRALSDKEIQKLWPCFNKLLHKARDIQKLGLLTAQRPGEICKMRWEDIDFKEKLWTIRNTKTGNIHVVPLSDQVQDILLNRRYSAECAHNPEWVFPSSSQQGFVRSRIYARKKAQKMSGVTGWTSHDLRRTARTIMSRLQIEQHIRERVLNHSQSGILATYDRYDYLNEKRDALQKLADEIYRIVKPVAELRRVA